MLHAAAVHGRDMETVADWVMRHELNEAGVLLEDQRCSRLGFGNVLGLLHTEDRERSSIFSARQRPAHWKSRCARGQF